MNRLATPILLLIAAAPLRAADLATEQAIAKVAADIVAALGDGKPAVRLGTFAPDPRGQAARFANHGPELTRLLSLEFGKLGIKVDPKADFTLSADYYEAELANSTLQLVCLDFRLTDGKTGEVREFLAKIANQPAVARFLALPFQYPAGADGTAQLQTLKVAVDLFSPLSKVKPKPFLKGSVVLPAPESPFGIEILTAPARADPKNPRAEGDYNPVTPTDEDGLAFAKIDRDRPFAVRLVNHADFEAAVELSIDGLNLFAASDPEYRHARTERPKFESVIVPARQGDKPGTLLVRGWFRNLNASDEFRADALPLGLRCAGAIGVVNARFHATAPKGKEFPEGEPESASRYATSSEPAEQATVPRDTWPPPRKIGMPRANVAVRFARD